MNESGRALFLSLGSNLGDREANLGHALRRVGQEVRVVAVSSLYETAPVGVTDQPAFLNVAVHAESTREPLDLLRTFKAIEHDVGRRATFRWGPRVVDIDILLYGELIVETPQVTIPHREMAARAFVMVPLAEIASGTVHPTLGVTIGTLAARSGGRETVKRAGTLST